MSKTYTEKYVFPDVKAGSIDSSDIWRIAFYNNSAGKPRDGTLLGYGVISSLVARDCVHHNEVDWTFR